ncbi:MAG TPA: hypothetical protein VKP69_34590 [Isosphaeraceae bacterium]|nr:hypothetical protein [Isosphaeraceae bacterium]
MGRGATPSPCRRPRGLQLKDVAQLDGWANDGSCDHVQALCDFTG